MILHEDLIADVLLGPTGSLSSPSSLCVQVLMKAIKQICEEPKLLVDALLRAKIDYPIFAFLTFPAMFGYYTCTELANKACQVMEAIVRRKKMNDDAILYICLSILFSCYRFTTNVWIILSNSLEKEREVTKKVMKAKIASCVSDCSPLVPLCVKRVLSQLLRWKTALLTKIVVSEFLPKTFEMWSACGPAGVGFRYKDLVIECLNEMQQSHEGMMLSSLLLTDRGQISVLPSFTGQCEMSNDKLIVCPHDFLVLSEVLRPCSSEIEMFDQLKLEADRFDCIFTPMIVNIFFPVSHNPSPFLNGPIMNITSDNDPIYLKAYYEKRDLPDKAFKRFKFAKDIEIGRDLLKDQELVITRADEFNIAQTLQTIILGLRSMYWQKLVYNRLADNVRFKSQTASELMSIILDGTTDFPGLACPVYLAIIDAGLVPKPSVSPELLASLTFLLKGQTGECWLEIGEMATCTFFLRLVPLLANVANLSYTESFIFITNFLAALRSVCNRFAKDPSEDTFAAMIRAVVVSAASDALISRFFFFERIVLHDSDFMRGLDEATATNWNVFFQAVWRSIATNRELFLKCPQYST